MHIKTNTSLKPFNTFGIDVKAITYCSVTSIEELDEALFEFQGHDIFVLGGGSNMLLRQDITDPVLHVNLKGIKLISEKKSEVIVRAMAGENWHDFVLWCIDKDYGGLENLSLIPGNVGATPIQNIGAYGVEMKDLFVSCEAVHIKTREIKRFSAQECRFGYRESVFKNELKGQYIITSVDFKLSKDTHKLKTSYGAIKTQLEKYHISDPSIRDISNAVIAIRQSKLPDPKEIGNSGSFFKNPVVSMKLYNELKTQFADIPGYPVSDDSIKVPAGWLIETAGFKGKRFGDYGVHKHQALVLVNYGNARGEDIYKLATLIQKTVKRLFNINLIMEVNVI